MQNILTEVSGLKQQTYYFTVSVSKEFGSRMTGGSDSGCLIKLQLAYKLVLQSLKELLLRCFILITVGNFPPHSSSYRAVSVS